MEPIVVLIAALTVYRLTMLVVADELTEPWRDRIIGRYVHPTHELTHLPREGVPPIDGYAYSAECRCGMSWVGDEWADVMAEANSHVNEHRGEQTEGPRWLILLDCPWCASFWVALPVGWSAWCFGDRVWWFIPASAFAYSAVTGIVATFAKPGH